MTTITPADLEAMRDLNRKLGRSLAQSRLTTWSLRRARWAGKISPASVDAAFCLPLPPPPTPAAFSAALDAMAALAAGARRR